MLSGNAGGTVGLTSQPNRHAIGSERNSSLESQIEATLLGCQVYYVRGGQQIEVWRNHMGSVLKMAPLTPNGRKEQQVEGNCPHVVRLQVKHITIIGPSLVITIIRNLDHDGRVNLSLEDKYTKFM
ncbi:hypothetical protein E2C01_032474 [Portunus trituberculatus]|uniref:Uncharacterized protein n=1 Tax=Portunus trituberculatus TaxID=210409 RepID=A0A5B7F0T6_PORTR|nr:hypothetical protein [Portunus trituberculatus]